MFTLMATTFLRGAALRNFLFTLLFIWSWPTNAILKGEDVSADSPMFQSVFALVKGDIEDPRAIQICAAFVVSESSLLTAAHCVEDETGKYWLVRTRDLVREVFRRRGFNSSINYARIRRISKEQIHLKEGYRGANGFERLKNDLALVTMGKGWYPNIVPVKLKEFLFRPEAEDQKVTVFGYGETSPFLGDYGTLHRISKKIVGIRNNDLSESYELVLDQSDQSGICTGDSGGPALVENEENGFAAVAVSTNVSKFEGRICVTESFPLALVPHLNWLQSIDPSIVLDHG